MGQGVGERGGDTAGIRGPDGLRGKKIIKAGIRGPDGQIKKKKLKGRYPQPRWAKIIRMMVMIIIIMKPGIRSPDGQNTE